MSHQAGARLLTTDSAVHVGERRLACVIVMVLASVTGLWGQSKLPAQSAATSAYKHGQEAVRKGDLASARTYLEQAIRLSPGNAEFRASLGWVLWRQ